MDLSLLLDVPTLAGDLVGVFGNGGEGVIIYCDGNASMWCNYHSYIVPHIHLTMFNQR